MTLLETVRGRLARKRVHEIHIRGTLSHDTLRVYFQGEPYTLISTSGAQRAQAGDLRIIFQMDSYVSHAIPRLIGATRSHVKARLAAGLITPVEPPAGGFRVSRVGRMPPMGTFSDVYELDITAAWLTSAKLIGAVSPAFYRRIIKTATKDERLRIIGALGSRRMVQEFDGNGQLIGKAVHEYSCPETAPVLRWIRAHTDHAMQALARKAGKDLAFYFADAIFIRKDRETAAALRRKAKAMGFALKGARKVYRLSVQPNPYARNGSKVPTVTRRGEASRPFCVGWGVGK